MSERRFSEEEVAAILKYATEAEQRQEAALPSGSGLTLAELSAIGKEVGISPEAMQLAVRKLDSPTGETRTFLGIPLGVGRTIELDRKLTDEEWDRLVVDLRETFDARGVVRQEGSLRSWSNGNLQALLEPTATGQRLRLRTMKGTARRLITASLALFGITAVTAVSGAMNGRLVEPAFLSSLLTTGIIGAAMLGVGTLGLPSWARLRRKQMDAIADRVAANDTQRRLPD